MVWRKVTPFMLGLLFALALAMPTRATAAEVYDGNISTTYITIFQDIATKIGLEEDYVFFRSGQYEYMMVVGQLDYTGSNFSSEDLVDVYTITMNSSYNSSYVYSVSTQAGFTLSPGTALIYSNLGNYPDLIERGDYLAFSAVLLLFIGLVLYLLRSIFGFCLRQRG